MTPVGGGGTWRSTRGQPHGQVARGFWGLLGAGVQLKGLCVGSPVLSPCSQRQASHQSTQNPITTENTAPAQATPFRLQPTSTSTSSSTSTSAKHRQPNLPRPPIATPPVSRRPSVRYTRTAHCRYRYRISPHLQNVLSGPLAAYPPTPCQRPCGRRPCDERQRIIPTALPPSLSTRPHPPPSLAALAGDSRSASPIPLCLIPLPPSPRHHLLSPSSAIT